MKQFTSQRGNFDLEDIEIMRELFPEVKRYDTKAFSYDMLNFMPTPILIMNRNKELTSAFVYDGYDINYLNMSQRSL